MPLLHAAPLNVARDGESMCGGRREEEMNITSNVHGGAGPDPTALAADHTDRGHTHPTTRGSVPVIPSY